MEPSERATEADRNKEIVRRFVEAGNARDYETLERLVSPTFHRHCQATPGVEVRSFADLRRFLQHDAESVPDNRVELATLVAEGDLVAFWATYTGTQTGSMGPFPASGKRMSVEFGGIFRIEDERIAELTLTWDNMAALVQLGHLASPGGALEAPSRSRGSKAATSAEY